MSKKSEPSVLLPILLGIIGVINTIIFTLFLSDVFNRYENEIAFNISGTIMLIIPFALGFLLIYYQLKQRSNEK